MHTLPFWPNLKERSVNTTGTMEPHSVGEGGNLPPGTPLSPDRSDTTSAAGGGRSHGEELQRGDS